MFAPCSLPFIASPPSTGPSPWRRPSSSRCAWRPDPGAAPSVSADINIRLGDRPAPVVVFDEEPEVVLVPRSRVYYVEHRGYDLYRYGRYWYINDDGYWFRAAGYRGPFVGIELRHVPRSITVVPDRYRHHPIHPAHPHGGPPGQLKNQRTVVLEDMGRGRGRDVIVVEESKSKSKRGRRTGRVTRATDRARFECERTARCGVGRPRAPAGVPGGRRAAPCTSRTSGGPPLYCPGRSRMIRPHRRAPATETKEDGMKRQWTQLFALGLVAATLAAAGCAPKEEMPGGSSTDSTLSMNDVPEAIAPSPDTAIAVIETPEPSPTTTTRRPRRRRPGPSRRLPSRSRPRSPRPIPA